MGFDLVKTNVLLPAAAALMRKAAERLRAPAAFRLRPGVAAVAIPTLLAALYYGVWATPRFVSEAQFVVRSVSSSHVSGLDALMKTFGLSRAADDANVVRSYLLSRDAVEELKTRIDLRQIFSYPGADSLSRFPRAWESDSAEGLYDHYQWRVHAINDATKGILTLRAEAYRAEDARRIVAELVSLSEAMINRMNSRSQRDAVAAAQAELKTAEKRVLDAQLALTEFRNAAALVDPSKTATSTLETITSLTNDLLANEVRIHELRQSAPASPTLSGLDARAASLRGRIAEERAKLAGDDDGLAKTVSRYEKLTLARDLADRTLASTFVSLETARNDAQRQHIYIELLATPNLPDEATEPRRVRMIATVFLLTLMTSSVLWLLMAGAKEHGE